MEGLKNLLIAFGDRAKTHIKFNVVICPPYSRKKLDAIKEFFDKLDYLPAGIDIKYSYVESGSLRKEDIDYTYFPEGEDIIGDVPPIDIMAYGRTSKTIIRSKCYFYTCTRCIGTCT